MINYLPHEIINLIQNNIQSLYIKHQFKLSSKFINTCFSIPLNFTNKFLYWTDKMNYDISYINLNVFKQFDKEIEGNNCREIKIWYSYIPKDIYTFTISPENITFQPILDFEKSMYNSTVRIHSKDKNEKNWLWYHSIIKFKLANQTEWKEVQKH